MKKLFILPLVFVTLFSCQKEDVRPNGSLNEVPDYTENCNCGIITDDDIIIDANGTFYYSLTIQNDCSGNLGTYYFSQSVWMDAHVGEYFCISNVSSWLPEGSVDVVQKIDVKNKEVQ